MKLVQESYGCPGWAQSADQLPPPQVLSQRVLADFAVLGGGLTGLSAARQLAALAPEKKIVILERGRVGFGASGRSSGFIMDIPHYEKALGVEGNRRMLHLGLAGIGHLKQLVRHHGLSCEWAERGCLRGAATERGLQRLEEFAEGMERLGERVNWLSQDEVAAVTGSQFYRAAIHCHRPILVQPFKLARGLAASLPAQVELYEDSPVTDLQLGNPVRLEVAAGEVRAEKLLLAANGYLPSLGLLKRRIVPLVTFASLTCLMPAELISKIGGDAQWGLIPEGRIGTTVRRIADGRILIRNSVDYHPRLGLDRSRVEQALHWHRRSLAARFPALARLPFSTTWAGVLGMTLNNSLFFGRLPRHRQVFVAAGLSGVGIAMGTIAGKLLADLCLDSDGEELRLIQGLPTPWPLPPAPAMALGARLLIHLSTRRGKGEI